MTAAIVCTGALAGSAAVAEVCWEGGNVPLTQAMRDDYEKRFATCLVDPTRKAEAEAIATRVMKNRGRYEVVERATHVPWYAIALIHNMECSGDFRCHLHNGDPLSARTKNVPRGRPATGTPPFDWTTSAIDALQFDGFDVWSDWSLSGMLFKLEAFNGFGYRSRSVPTPYLWAGSNHDLNGDGRIDELERKFGYTAGKFVKDGRFDPAAASRQIGAAVLLRRLVDQYLVALETPVVPDRKCEGMTR